MGLLLFHLPKGILTTQLASFLNNHIALATHLHMARSLRKEAYQNLIRDIHITHWKQLCSPVVPPLSLVSEITRRFRYTAEGGWDNSAYPFIPLKGGNDPSGFECAREEPLAKFFNMVSGVILCSDYLI